MITPPCLFNMHHKNSSNEFADLYFMQLDDANECKFWEELLYPYTSISLYIYMYGKRRHDVEFILFNFSDLIDPEINEYGLPQFTVSFDDVDLDDPIILYV